MFSIPQVTPHSTTFSVEIRRDRLAAIARWALVACVGVVIAPLAFTLLQAALALLVTGVISMTVIAFAPVFAMKLANWKLAALLAEARNNPMPTLENELLKRHQALHSFADQLRASMAQVASFADGAEEAARQYPDLATRWRERADKARALCESQKRSYARARQAVEEFERVVERCRIEWKLVCAEAAMNKSLSHGLNDPMAQLRSHTAIAAITDRMNEAFAGLELELLQHGSSAERSMAAPAVAVARLDPRSIN